MPSGPTVNDAALHKPGPGVALPELGRYSAVEDDVTLDAGGMRQT